jgi:hypothetical protein
MQFIKYLLIIVFLIVCNQNAISQNDNEREIKSIVIQFFESFKSIDTLYLNSLATSETILSSSFVNKSNVEELRHNSYSDFVNSISKSIPGELNESISNLEITVHNGLAFAKMDYLFYYKNQLLHCGKNFFTFGKSSNNWKIISLADTRSTDCTDIPKEINNTLDKWHKAATEADSTTYFDLIADDGIFVGTDKTEVWTKDQFLSFASPYFAKGKAWDFTSISRNIYNNTDSLVWFDELLDTWMGPCRGSGVLANQNGEWKIKHYVLSVTIPNDDIQKFLEIYQDKVSDDNQD